MLRVSATTTDTEVDIQGMNGDAVSAAKGIEYGAELMRFAESIATRDQPALIASRAALLACAGAAVLVDAAGVAANFQRMVRIADAIGIPVDNMDSDLGRSVRAELHLDRFASAQNSLKADTI
jgi:hypothetical protein